VFYNNSILYIFICFYILSISGERFNQSINNLPNSITHLTLGDYFNQPVENLPHSITHLTFGAYFNQPVNKLPSSITHLSFGEHFNQPLDNLPNTLTHLLLGYNFNKTIQHLPESVIELGFFSNYIFRDNLPYFIEIVKIYFARDYVEYKKKYIIKKYYITNLPPTIKQIKVKNYNNALRITKIPFGCIVTDFDNNYIEID
jgi:hypothetical protein